MEGQAVLVDLVRVRFTSEADFDFDGSRVFTIVVKCRLVEWKVSLSRYTGVRPVSRSDTAFRISSLLTMSGEL